MDPHDVPFTTGRHQVADGCHAWLQPDGGWGWSNAGLVVSDGASLLVDTLFDLRLTQAMLDGLAPLTAAAPIATPRDGANTKAPTATSEIAALAATSASALTRLESRLLTQRPIIIAAQYPASTNAACPPSMRKRSARNVESHPPTVNSFPL